MISFKKIFFTLTCTALLFHTIWVVPAFLKYKSNNVARSIFEIVHPGASYGTIKGYFISDFWIIVYSFSASVIFVFFYNLFNNSKD